MKEVWKDVIGYEGLYQVSNFGKIKSLRKNIIMKTQKRGSRENNKYETVKLCGKNQKAKNFSIHRLVAKAFLPNPNNLKEVNHKDENKMNNNLDNLEWSDQSYNRKYSINRGSIKYVKGYENKSCSLKYDEVVWIKENLIYGDTYFGVRALGKKFNVDKKVISNIYKNLTYKNVKCKYVLFIISDIHGHYKEMLDALEKAGFNENKYNHKLICLGDWTDREPNVLAVYEYLKKLVDKGSAIVTMGNHEKFFINFLEGSYNPFNYLHNGLSETVADFWHRTAPFESWCMLEGNCTMTQENYAKWVDICRKDINEEYPELLPWLKSLPRYFETKNYIMVHGAIDTKVSDWHNPHCYRGNLIDWDALDFDDGYFFGSQINNTNKTVIIGHFGTEQLRKMYQDIIKNDTGDTYDILYRDDNKIIAIDATTVISKLVNVLVIEGEELLDVA